MITIQYSLPTLYYLYSIYSNIIKNSNVSVFFIFFFVVIQKIRYMHKVMAYFYNIMWVQYDSYVHENSYTYMHLENSDLLHSYFFHICYISFKFERIFYPSNHRSIIYESYTIAYNTNESVYTYILYTYPFTTCSTYSRVFPEAKSSSFRVTVYYYYYYYYCREKMYTFSNGPFFYHCKPVRGLRV